MNVDAKDMRTFGITDVFKRIISLEEHDYCNADDKIITMFVGATKCGKSTTVNLFLRNPLIIKMDDDSTVPKLNRKIVLVHEKENDNKFPAIGTKTVSMTSVPIKYEMENGEILWDCPGFGDSRGAQQEIVNALFVNRLFETAKGVKLFNLVSSEALIQSNVNEFCGYIRQLMDLLGIVNISSLNQTLVFTKAGRNDSIDDLKESLMYLLEEHFPKTEYEELHNFFNKAKFLKIEKPEKGDIGNTMTINDISELIEACNVMRFQKMKPYVAVDDRAKVFLLHSVTELSIVSSDNMKNAYKKAYQSEMKGQLEEIFKQQCTEKNFLKLSKQFIRAKQASIDKVSSDPAIIKEEKLLEEITDFVLKIIPENTILKSIVETNINAIKCYNKIVLDYNVTVKFLNFLKDHSSHITERDTFHKIWDNQIALLKKPKISDLSRNLEVLYEKSVEANNKILILHDQGNLEAEKKVCGSFKNELEAAQKKYIDEMHEFEQKLFDASRPSGWAKFPIFGSIVKDIIGLFTGPPKSPDAPKFSKLDTPEVCKTLDISFSCYLAKKNPSLLGDIVHDYWE